MKQHIVQLIKILRADQWIKNLIVYVPLLLTPSLLNLSSFMTASFGVVCFCLISSAVYVSNDFIDRKTDRLHPTKKQRPIAAKTVSKQFAIYAFAICLAAGLIGSLMLTREFFIAALAYLFIGVLYTLWLKQFAIIEFLTISSGFIVRLFAGASLIYVVPSPWLIYIVALLAIFMVLGKRRDDLTSGVDTKHRAVLKDYSVQFIDMSIVFILTSILVSYSIFITDRFIIATLGSQYLYTTIPFVVAGLLRYLQIILVEQKSADPITILWQDRFIQITLLLWAGLFSGLVYF